MGRSSGTDREKSDSGGSKERISEIEALIQTKQAEIIDLQTTLDGLKEEKQKSDLLKLSQAITESGMSIDEALDMFRK